MRSIRSAILLLVLVATPLAAAEALPESLILVAKPALRDALYGGTVLVVHSFGAGQHFGFIVNRPTRTTLGELFPQHGPSQEITDPVFLGGPIDAQRLFALIAAEESPGRGCVEVVPGLFVAYDGRVVDRIIEENPDDARFLAGMVVWRPGELAHEIAQGAWYVMKADPALALKEPKGLWEELVRRSQLARHLRRS